MKINYDQYVYLKVGIAKKLYEMEDFFYGEEDDGIFIDNYELAEWSRDNVPELFGMVRKLLNEHINEEDKQSERNS